MNDLPIEGMKIIPLGWPMMADAYLGCVSWALTEDKIKQAFKTETGHDLDALAKASPADRRRNAATVF